MKKKKIIHICDGKIHSRQYIGMSQDYNSINNTEGT